MDDTLSMDVKASLEVPVADKVAPQSTLCCERSEVVFSSKQTSHQACLLSADATEAFSSTRLPRTGSFLLRDPRLQTLGMV